MGSNPGPATKRMGSSRPLSFFLATAAFIPSQRNKGPDTNMRGRVASKDQALGYGLHFLYDQKRGKEAFEK